MPEQGGPGPGGSPRALVGLGFEITVPIVLCMYAGYKMDHWLDSSPWWFLVGAILGITVAIYSFVRRVLPPRRGSGGDRS